ncbi:hypothetical protein [Halodesulfovibrio sp.]|uniref:hypothetical protein n=1 Tax=Halodesulfovibrio sp. TaxID=1912772 RepID=UPI0025E0F41F|nr:hypothetical protein [Halodesulfovibrio sp.]MCT4533739.1 hypothetical protein [Halodesulfovibrio sp.]
MLKVFIACPYSQYKKSIYCEQLAASAQLASALILRNVAVYSPATHNHSIYDASQPEDHVSSTMHENLRLQSLSFHSWADALFVIDFPETTSSGNIQEDITLFREAEKPVRFIDPSNIQSNLDTLLEELTQCDSPRLKHNDKEKPYARPHHHRTY